jgi:hypothetical protein
MRFPWYIFSQKVSKIIQACRCVPINPSYLGTEAGGSLEPMSSRPAYETLPVSKIKQNQKKVSKIKCDFTIQSEPNLN